MSERNGGLMEDTISRKMAIDIVQGYAEQLQGYIGMPNDSEVYAYARGLLLSIDRNINALPSAQPETHDKRTKTHSCDLIDRQAAIEALQEHRNLFCDNTPETFSKLSYAEKSRVDELDMAIATLINLPSAQPDLSEYSDKLWKAAYERGRAEAQQRWIPCSERLPEERQEILATTTDNAWGDVVIIRTYYKEMHKSVIAWMPLPKPYRAERRTDGV